MFDKELVREILGQILTATRRIERRFSGIRQPDAFLDSEEGLDKLDGICMMLITIGENLKRLDKITEGKLLVGYPAVDWKGAKGMRDIISHHYFDLNADLVFTVCMERLPGFIETIQRIKEEV